MSNSENGSAQASQAACPISKVLTVTDWVSSENAKLKAPRERSVWYAMRATYRRETDAIRLLDAQGLGSFVPMHYKVTEKRGRKVRELVPVVRNLLFVNATPTALKEVKSQVSYLQYITDTRSKQKIIVPDNQMQRFIAVAGTYNDQLLYFPPEELNLTKGTRVRVIGGEFEGLEGTFIKVRGARDRRVVIEIQGVIAVATTTIHPDLIEVIE